MLDTNFPYKNVFEDVGVTLENRDSPGTELDTTNFIDEIDIGYKRQDSFNTYLIYKPKGHEDHTIWVTLSVIEWGWSGTAIYDTTVTPSKWKLEDTVA